MKDKKPKFVLICHEDSSSDMRVLSSWINSFAELSGLIVIEESKGALFKRFRFEYRRSGLTGLLDVLAYRLFHRIFLKNKEMQLEKASIEQLSKHYPEVIPAPPLIRCKNPNSSKVIDFLKEQAPDFAIARCKFILKEKVFTLPSSGTFVMHPGVCPEYRNAHGCFWALVNEDYSNIGMTLLQVDKGVDTGPVYGYFSYSFDPEKDSPNTIQRRVVFDNLEALARKFIEIYEETTSPIDTKGRRSGVWGQPRLSSYLLWKWRYRSKTKQSSARGGANR